MPLILPNATITGIYNTVAGGDSTPSTPGLLSGNYPPLEGPNNIRDNNTSTKYLNFGSCNDTNGGDLCGINTGFYVTLQRGPSVVKAFQMCTANDAVKRDPVRITLEGSNQTGANLTLGGSWALLFDGSSGLEVAPPRFSCSQLQCVINSVAYASYRILVTGRRAPENCVQYSELQLFTY